MNYPINQLKTFSILWFLITIAMIAIYPLRLSATPKSEKEDLIQPSNSNSSLQRKQNITSNRKQTEFGTAGQERWYLQGAGAITIDTDDSEGQHFGLLGAGISHFFANGHSVNLELNSMAFNQAEKNAIGLNLSVILRWHFYRRHNWSLYFDGGAGILGTTNDVPSAGSNFNFTPQVGVGSTIPLTDNRRLMVGVRWHHISNADLYDSNPGRDSIMGYVGLNLPY